MELLCRDDQKGTRPITSTGALMVKAWVQGKVVVHELYIKVAMKNNTDNFLVIVWSCSLKLKTTATWFFER
jgi:hypothetical protein